MRIKSCADELGMYTPNTSEGFYDIRISDFYLIGECAYHLESLVRLVYNTDCFILSGLNKYNYKHKEAYSRI